MSQPIDRQKLSPMMRQYIEMKDQHKNHLLFFRLGDFYELFFDDAIIVSRELELTLTGKECGLPERAPMCGVPYHSVDTYLKKLVDRGYKVAICEQMENPALAKGLVKRDVIRVVTPGTVSESGMLDDGKNNYICSLYLKGNGFGVCFADVSTGTVHATEIHANNIQLDVVSELERFTPVELLYNPALMEYPEIGKALREEIRCTGELVEEDTYDLQRLRQEIAEQFGKMPEQLTEQTLCLCALGALVVYLKDTQKEGVKRLVDLQLYNDRQYMGLDAAARRNLELTRTMRTGDKRATLLWVLDKTKTAMGKRMMRKVLEQPLVNPAQITRRLAAVEALTQKMVARDEIAETLSGIYDLERLLTKVIYGSINPREMRALCQTIGRLPALKGQLAAFSAPLLQKLAGRIADLADVYELLDRALEQEPPVSLKDGGAVREGFHDELDELRHIRDHGKETILKMEAEEREKTGISKLKINYNRVFGYYIEVTKSFLDQVPDRYIRKQTLTGSERYITPELKEYEQKVMTASERSIIIEQAIFEELRQFVAKKLLPLQQTAEAVAMADVLCSFAEVAQKRQYTRPEITTTRELVIQNGRHPVVEAMLDMPFVPNDTLLDGGSNKMMVITGPNMAGKSTYMRQVALIVLMAQIGSFVPAGFARIGIVDKIFTRVGASDDLAAGQSTFMVEMSEVADILKNATPNSLVILDEIGRGTSTFDGMSIAKAVAEQIIKNPRLGCKTLFATHYHELTSLETELDGVVNYNIAVKKRGDDITFLRKIVPGGVDDSYGVAVAKLAGIPASVVKRANEILAGLEQGRVASPSPPESDQPPVQTQTTLGTQQEYAVTKRLRAVSLDTLTPIEAMNLLYELKQMVDG